MKPLPPLRWMVALIWLWLLVGLGASNAFPQERDDSRKHETSAEERVAGFVRLWSEVKYNFAFFERVPDLDWDKVLEEYLPRVLQAQTTEEYYRLLERCIAQLKDGHTTVYPPSIRRLAPLPLRLQMVDGRTLVSEVAEAMAAAEPRLKPGLEVTHIDGRAVAEILKQDVYPYIADSTPQNRDRWAARRLVEGEAGSQGKVRFQDGGGAGFELTLAHASWRYPQVPGYEYQDAGEGMAYVALNTFSSRDVAASFERAMEEIGKHQGLLIDVRNNGGGSSSNGYAVISRLIDKPIRGSKWKTRQYMPASRAWGQKEAWFHGEGSVIKPSAEKPFLGPVVVLIGPGTVSAAEDFVVALHAAGRVTLVGEKTAGTTGQPLMVQLPRGGSARICTKWDSYPDGREFVGIGVIPDVEVHPTRESLAAGRDVVLEKGMAVLAKQMGKDALDAASLAARLSLLKRRSSTEAGRDLPTVYKEIQVEYDALAAAHARKDWPAADSHAHDLSRIMRRDGLVFPADLERLREALKAAGLPEQQVEFDLARMKARKKEVEEFFRVERDSQEIHRLHAKIEDLSDDIHDCVRDGTLDKIGPVFEQLEQQWRMLRERMPEGRRE